MQDAAGEARTNSCDILRWIPTHEHASTAQPARTYLHQFCADTRCSLEDLQGAMDDMDRWSAIVWEIHAVSVT